MDNRNIDIFSNIFTLTIMTLTEISKLQKETFFIYDPAKVNFNPLAWSDMIHFYVGSKHKQVRRSSAFVYGLCEGVPGQLPPVSQAGGFKEGCGRKPIDQDKRKVPVTFWFEQKTVDILGGIDAFKADIKNHVKSKL